MGLRYFLNRFIRLISVLLVVTFLATWMLSLFPGGRQARVTFKVGPGATQEQLDKAYKELNLDKPLVSQYVLWVKKAATADFGVSGIYNEYVTKLVRNRLGATLVTMFYAQLIALGISIPLALWAAYRRNGPIDRALNTFAFGSVSMPNYIFALFLLYVLAVRLKRFPALSKNVSLFESPWRHFKVYFIPSLALAFPLIGTYFRLLRVDLISTLQSDFITTARAKGLSTSRIMVRHALRPSLFSLVTAAGLNTAALIGGAVVIEQLTGLGGLGSLLIDAIFRRDFEVVQVIVAMFAVLYVLLNFVVDMAYGWLDPRIRHARALS